PAGIPEEEADSWLTSARSGRVQSVRAATWDRCGRPQNAFLTLADGTSACARYRHPRDRLVLGEVLSYWLSRTLGLDSVPPVTLTFSDSLLEQKPRDFCSEELRWEPAQTVALIRWVDEVDSRPKYVFNFLSLCQVCKSATNATATGNSENESESKTKATTITESESESETKATEISQTAHPSSLKLESLVTLAQWGTMIIFDYLTGNYDRVASMQDGVERENDPTILEQSIRNLRPSKRGAKLWLIDNESGLLDAYTVLYLQHSVNSKFIQFHESMLRTMCVFQSSLVRRVERLYQHPAPHRALMRTATHRDALVRKVARDESFRLFREKFPQRLANVVRWIQDCREMVKQEKDRPR
ncbi:hypothetical protein EGW08_002667, partial [Elysia chlorotica]